MDGSRRLGGGGWRTMWRLAGCAALIGGLAPAVAGCGSYLRSRARQVAMLNGQHRIMAYGGPGLATYLGCLTCRDPDRDSVFTGGGNLVGETTVPSVVNPGSVFVSAGSPYSACNPFASDPPQIVDERGKYYGRLTVNQSRPDGPPSDVLRTWILQVCGRA
jgi:hypothetical protein